MKIRALVPLVAFTAVVLAGCATMAYDSQTDQQITNLSQEVNQQLVTWEFAEAAHPHFTQYDPKYYAKVETDLTLLQMRMNSGSGTGSPVQPEVFAQMHHMLDDERAKQQNRKGPPDAIFFHAERIAWNTQLRSLSDYELALKPVAGGTSTAADGGKAKASNPK